MDVSRELLQVEPRNLTWIPQGELAYLQVSNPARGLYVQLINPSHELAMAALWEAVQSYVAEWQGQPHAPPLEIRASPRHA